ncbi:MAG: hypothetical protein WCG01_01565 [bacterium]
MKIHFDQVQDLTGFALEGALGGETVKILTRSLLTSDDPEFYLYSEKISNIFFNGILISPNMVHQFLVIIHSDLSADLYVNDINILLEVKVKKDIKQGEAIMQDDIADIRKVKFPDIEITESDKVIYCFKVGWRFGLFFDLGTHVQTVNTPPGILVEKLDLDKMSLSIGDIYRYLSFYHVYKTLEAESRFKEIIKDGWFPFIEIIGSEFKLLTEIYHDKFDFQNRITQILNNFTKERIDKISNKWWGNDIFANKKELIMAGIKAYLDNDQSGYINCIKNLWSETEGILRAIYHIDTGKGNNVKTPDLISHIINKAKNKSGSDFSLLLPLSFLEYLKDVAFASFNTETGDVELSRNSSGHGVAEVNQYTKIRALQLILILDQIYYYG